MIAGTGQEIRVKYTGGALPRHPSPMSDPSLPDPRPGLPEGPILPRVKTLRFIEAAAGIAGMTPDQIPLTVPVIGDLLLSFSVDTGEQFIFLTPRECARRGLDAAALRQQALDNARPLIEGCRLLPHGDVMQLKAGQDMDACTLLFPEVWERIALSLGEDPVVLFAHKSLVCLAPAGSAPGLAALRGIVAELDYTTTHALSRQLYRFSDGRWHLHDGPTDRPGLAEGDAPDAASVQESLWRSIDHFDVHEALVRDRRTGLMWMRCVIGAGWDGQTIQGHGIGHTWGEALALARGFSFAGFRDWRLPSPDELMSLVDEDGGDDAHGLIFMHPEVFGTAARFRNARGVVDLAYHAGRVWTHSPHEDDDSFAWAVDFTTRARCADPAPKLRRMGVRLVRSDRPRASLT